MSYAPYLPLTRNVGVGAFSVPYDQPTFMGFGSSSSFNGSVTWSDWLAGSKGNNAAGMRAADAIRAALGGIGYGPFTTGVAWGTAADKAGFAKFVDDHQLTRSSVAAWWPTQTALIALQEAVARGGNQGGGPIQTFHVVDGQQIPGAAPGASLAGMSGTTIGLLLGAAVVIGGLALMSKKKRGVVYGDGTGPGVMAGTRQLPRYASNPSKKRKRGTRGYKMKGRKRGTRRFKMKGRGIVEAFAKLDRAARRRDLKLTVVRSRSNIIRKADGSTWRVVQKVGYLEDGSAHRLLSPQGKLVVMHDDDIRRGFRRDI